jgi:amino acid transporter
VEAAFGRYAGNMTSVALWLGAGLAAAGVGVAIADTMARILPLFAQPLWRDAFIVILFMTLAAINIWGVREGGRLVLFTLILKLLPLVALVLGGGLVLATGGAIGHLATPARAVQAFPVKANVGRAVLLGMFAFMGMETAMGVLGEVRQPARNVPLGLLGALGSVTVLYILIQLVTAGLLGPDLAAAKTPLADAGAVVLPALGGVLLAAGAVSMLGYLSSDILSAPRILFGMARDGYLPAPLAAVHPKTRTPYVAILTHVGLVGALAVTGAFEPLAVLSVLITLFVYIAGCAAAVVLQRRGVAEEGDPMNFRFTPAAAVIGAVSMAWVALQGTWQEGAAVAAAMAVFSLIYGVALRRRPGA